MATGTMPSLDALDVIRPVAENERRVRLMLENGALREGRKPRLYHTDLNASSRSNKRMKLPVIWGGLHGKVCFSANSLRLLVGSQPVTHGTPPHAARTITLKVDPNPINQGLPG
jgi:hypothetical protein